MTLGITLDSLNLLPQDYSQRYISCYVEVSIKGKEPSVVQIVEFEQQLDGKMHVYIKDSSGVRKYPLFDVAIIREFPEMGACNIDGDVFVLRINPDRQWSRGLREHRIHSYSRNLKVVRPEEHLTLARATQIFHRTYPSESEGLRNIREGKIQSFAINSRYWYSGTPKNVFMWRGKVCLGELIGKKLFFFNLSTSLVHEVNQELGKAYE